MVIAATPPTSVLHRLMSRRASFTTSLDYIMYTITQDYMLLSRCPCTIHGHRDRSTGACTKWLKWPGQAEGVEGVGNLAHFEHKRTFFIMDNTIFKLRRCDRLFLQNFCRYLYLLIFCFSQTWLRYVWLMAWQIRLSSVSVTSVHPTQGFKFSGIFCIIL